MSVLFLREFATRGEICALRSLYSAESLLLRVTQDTATGGMRTSPYDFLPLLLLCFGEVRIHGGLPKQKDTRKECPFVLVTRTGIEPMLQP